MREILLISLLLTAASADGVQADMRDAMARAKARTFDTSAPIRCAQEVGQPLGECTAAVARAGSAAVVNARFANGFARLLSFDDGAFLRGNATMSGVGTDTEWQLSEGVYLIRVDDQRFEIPRALIVGE